MDGKIKIGLEPEELKRLTPDCLKTSIRDMAYVLSKKLDGATTVSSTLFAAKHAKIPLFVTGGIGGVHRDAFDISADLKSLAESPVTVVCAGIKSILDIPKTLEVLEALGVFVGTIHSPTFPSFYTSTSGMASPYSLSHEECAAVMHIQRTLGLSSGMLIGVPLLQSFFAQGEIETAIQSALQEAAYFLCTLLMSQAQIVGKAITPFLLSKVAEKTAGQSLAASEAPFLFPDRYCLD